MDEYFVWITTRRIKQGSWSVEQAWRPSGIRRACSTRSIMTEEGRRWPGLLLGLPESCDAWRAGRRGSRGRKCGHIREERESFYRGRQLALTKPDSVLSTGSHWRCTAPQTCRNGRWSNRSVPIATIGGHSNGAGTVRPCRMCS